MGPVVAEWESQPAGEKLLGFKLLLIDHGRKAKPFLFVGRMEKESIKPRLNLFTRSTWLFQGSWQRGTWLVPWLLALAMAESCSVSPSSTLGTVREFSSSPGWKWEWGEKIKLVSQLLICLVSNVSNRAMQPCVRIAMPGKTRHLSSQYLSQRISWGENKNRASLQ